METFCIQRGTAHFYICSSIHGYVAKTIGDSEEAQKQAERLVGMLNSPLVSHSTLNPL